MSAVTKVFESYELLEDILLRLPIQDLTQAQRVNKYFKSLITNSKPIRRALFFEPSKSGAVEWYPIEKQWKTRGGSKTSKVLHLNPFANRYFVSKAEEVQGLDGLFLQFFPHRSRVRPSWRSMLLTQPPIRVLTIKQCSVKAPGYIWIENEKGVTIGDFVDAVRRNWRQGGLNFNRILEYYVWQVNGVGKWQTLKGVLCGHDVLAALD